MTALSKVWLLLKTMSAQFCHSVCSYRHLFKRIFSK